MKIGMSLACLVVLATSCKKIRQACEPNACIEARIKDFATSAICKTGAAVKEYVFQDRTVYIFDETYCVADGAAGVYDFNCNYLGTLGTIAGLRKINGIPFYENAKYIRTIWQN